MEFSEKFSAYNFALSDAEHNTQRALKREGIIDLPLLTTILAILKKAWESNISEVVDCFKNKQVWVLEEPLCINY